MKNLVIGTSILIMSLTVGAATPENFNEKKFEIAQAEGKTILLDFHQEGCGTCKKQEAILKEISKTKNYSEVTFYKVNFDEQKDLNKRFKVNSKSTLVLLKGRDEIDRAIGITSKEDISELINKGINL